MTKFATLFNAIRATQTIALALLTVLAVGLVGSCFAAAVGVLPWLDLPMTFGETTYANAGMITQITCTLVTASMLFLVPTNRRIMQLEQSHRDFQISMEDVARAFYTCHTADRTGAFTMSSEFDAVRERLNFLREHPDLRKLEPQVLEVASQMSQQSKKLAEIYSDENIARAKEFLTQRQTEAEKQEKRIADALIACDEIKTWTREVEIEESKVRTQLDRLDNIVRAALPPLGYDILRKDTDEDAKRGGSTEIPKRSTVDDDHDGMNGFPVGAMLAAE